MLFVAIFNNLNEFFYPKIILQLYLNHTHNDSHKIIIILQLSLYVRHLFCVVRGVL